MRTVLVRAATTAACALAVTAALGGTAQATTVSVLPGCYGVGPWPSTVMICNLRVEVDYALAVPVYTYTWEQEVCAGTCGTHSLPFAWYDLNDMPEVNNACLVYEDRGGSVTRTCVV